MWLLPESANDNTLFTTSHSLLCDTPLIYTWYSRHFSPYYSQNPWLCLLFKKKSRGRFTTANGMTLDHLWCNWNEHQSSYYYPWGGCVLSYQYWNNTYSQNRLLPWSSIISLCNKLSQKCWASSLLWVHTSPNSGMLTPDPSQTVGSSTVHIRTFPS